MTWQIIQGDCLDLLRGVTVVHADPFHSVSFLDIEPDSVDAIVTDPPYGIHFMNKSWDTFGGPTGKRHTGGTGSRVAGGAMHAGTYDLSKNAEFQKGIAVVFREAFRVAKPGAYLVAFGGTRTHHRLACAIEDAGFEIRDCLMWLYGSGFPKSHNVAAAIDKRAGHPNRGRAIPTASTYQACDENRQYKLTANRVTEYEPITEEAKEHAGKGTALKPAWEPIYLARKPLIGTVADNVLQHSSGALNIDACRIGFSSEADESETKNKNRHADFQSNPRENMVYGADRNEQVNYNAQGRWPANVILSHHPDCEYLGLKKVRGYAINRFTDGAKPFGGGAGHEYESIELGERIEEDWRCSPDCAVSMLNHESAAETLGGAARFFYTSKASKSEREAGLERQPPRVVNDGRKKSIDNPYQRAETKRQNTHPTVKPLDLMRWLVRLVTPAGGVVLDPFCGSGTTVMAARIEGFDGIGIEKEYEAAAIARRRVAHAGEIAGNATAADAVIMDKPTQLGLLK